MRQLAYDVVRAKDFLAHDFVKLRFEASSNLVGIAVVVIHIYIPKRAGAQRKATMAIAKTMSGTVSSKNSPSHVGGVLAGCRFLIGVSIDIICFSLFSVRRLRCGNPQSRYLNLLLEKLLCLKNLKSLFQKRTFIS
nr:MAG TPA: hypothetical protein [Bacteriophage sp.]